MKNQIKLDNHLLIYSQYLAKNLKNPRITSETLLIQIFGFNLVSIIIYVSRWTYKNEEHSLTCYLMFDIVSIDKYQPYSDIITENYFDSTAPKNDQ